MNGVFSYQNCLSWPQNHTSFQTRNVSLKHDTRICSKIWETVLTSHIPTHFWSSSWIKNSWQLGASMKQRLGCTWQGGINHEIVQGSNPTFLSYESHYLLTSPSWWFLWQTPLAFSSFLRSIWIRVVHLQWQSCQVQTSVFHAVTRRWLWCSSLLSVLGTWAT